MIQINTELKRNIESGSRAGVQRCWTCGSCDFECPVNIATGRLWPRKIVRMTAFGMLPELLELPDIWYCQNCLRCTQICPNTVSPAAIIDYLRAEKIRRGGIYQTKIESYRWLWVRFQRVRWQAAAICLRGGELTELSDERWHRWLDTPIEPNNQTISGRMDASIRRLTAELFSSHHTNACFTCGECSSACPVAGNRTVFDPRSLFRMFNLGLYQELLESPSIWLCLACQRCTACCSQKVDGAGMIKKLQNLALSTGVIEKCIPYKLERANKIIFKRLLSEIDQLFESTKPIQ